MFQKKYTKTIIITSLGAIAGFAYYFFIGCKTGNCMITSSPYISTVYGGIVGALIAWPSSKS